MRIDILSLFPEMFRGPLSESILARAQSAGLLEIKITNPRDFTTDKHHIVDDYPFGGGSGMIMKPEPFFLAVESLIQSSDRTTRRVVLMCPAGKPFDHKTAHRLSSYQHLILLCGHYEGIDERVRQHLADEAISIGDYVLTGGELPALVVTDAVARFIPGVLGAADAADHDSHSSGLLEYPQYTRPRQYNEWEVPAVLLSGNHAEIERWRRRESILRTWRWRPALLSEVQLTQEEQELLDSLNQNPFDGDLES